MILLAAHSRGWSKALLSDIFFKELISYVSTKGQQKSIPVFKNHPSKSLALRFVKECSFYYTVVTYSGKNQYSFGSLIIMFFPK